jgi:hypothetical protein
VKVLVVGPEAGGTKLVTGLLRQAGAEVEHCSPMYRKVSWGEELPHPDYFDRIVLVIRHGPWRQLASMDTGHTPPNHVEMARWWGAEGIKMVMDRYHPHRAIHICTLEALVYEPNALFSLLKDLGLECDKSTLFDSIGNPNEKWWGGEVFRDDRSVEERGVNA